MNIYGIDFGMLFCFYYKLGLDWCNDLENCYIVWGYDDCLSCIWLKCNVLFF